jgi:hypothetical protein
MKTKLDTISYRKSHWYPNQCQQQIAVPRPPTHSFCHSKSSHLTQLARSSTLQTNTYYSQTDLFGAESIFLIASWQQENGENNNLSSRFYGLPEDNRFNPIPR